MDSDRKGTLKKWSDPVVERSRRLKQLESKRMKNSQIQQRYRQAEQIQNIQGWQQIKSVF